MSTGVGLGLMPNTALASTALPTVQTWAMWIHGSAGRIEGCAHDGQKSPITMAKLKKKMMTISSMNYFRSGNNGGMPGTTVALEGEAAGTMIPTSGGGQFIIWDRGTKNNDKNGEFWVHYAIPTPLIAAGTRAKAGLCLVSCMSTDIKMHIGQVEVWHGNKSIFSQANTQLWGPEKMHRFNIPTTPSVMGALCISLKIKGERVNATKILEISGVGIDFYV
ncbi:hypothetical protein POV26_03225 [Aequorivita todarodis]|uniref:DUF6623 family protein n=1 Tax=Aequorivita todarodis TaxID=2036821 RepID=UPI00234FE5C4|nr:DUF6623 family protein [Aequorivita todarodis]MDC8000035.1 hypothetical protein [Aequorivita todarodis]